MNEFDSIAKKLWHADREVVRLIESLTDRDRINVQQRLLALYGVSINLLGSVDEIQTDLRNARRGAGPAD